MILVNYISKDGRETYLYVRMGIGLVKVRSAFGVNKYDFFCVGLCNIWMGP